MVASFLSRILCMYTLTKFVLNFLEFIKVKFTFSHKFIFLHSP
ncbi:hypothetical protein H477_1142 [[Clostridium] sordellii ATCC 9714]|nr:hypothetical protein H477_1142 [[Clostridium] sordellii ATCC 9714] [Paeniclostridium sordellii ATCC 9714]